MSLSMRRIPFLLPVMLGAVALSACAGTANRSATQLPWSNAQQMVVVTSSDWNDVHGTLRRFERGDNGGGWRQVGAAQPVMLGRSGIGWGIGLHPAQNNGPQKREGDGRNPAGVFAAIATRMAEQNISLESIVQHRPRSAQAAAAYNGAQPVILVTHTTTEQAVRAAVEAIARDGHLVSPPQN